MVAKRDWIKNLAKELVEILSQYYDIDRLILFGSYAWGKPNKYSDIDVAVISKSFKEMDDIERIVTLTNCVRKLKLAKKFGIDIIGFTPRELKRAGRFELAAEIKEKGEILYKKAA